MRILYVCADPQVTPHGVDGEAAHVRAVTGALTARGHAVTLACRRTDGPNPLARGVAMQVMPEGWQEQSRWLADQMRRLGIDAVVERMSLRSGPVVEATQRWPIPLLLHVTAPLVEEAARQDALDDVDDWRRWEARLLSAADHVVAVSEIVAWHVLGCGVPRDRVSVVPNGVDPMRFAGIQGHSVRLEYDLRRSFVVGWRGEIDGGHGLDEVVEALDMLPRSVRLLVVGDGPALYSVRAWARSLGVADRVAFAGSVLEAEVPAFLAACDAAVAPCSAANRLYRSPLELLEYCAAGLPVVATGQEDLGLLGGAALLVPQGDATALAEAISRLAGDRRLRERMARAARTHASSRTWERAGALIEEQVAAVLAHWRGQRTPA